MTGWDRCCPERRSIRLRLLHVVCVMMLASPAMAISARERGSIDAGGCPFASEALCLLFGRNEAGDIEAQRQIGIAFLTGRDVPRDEIEAARWLRRAAEGGSVAAQADYGELLLHSETPVHAHTQAGTPAEAAEWFRRAAEQGSARAQTHLGALYALGRGVPRDPAVAFTWFKRAAELGNPRGQYNVGVALELGDGVPPDRAAAKSWYARAALQGDERAMLNLASLLAGGRPDTEELLEAFAWLLLAEERGVGEVVESANASLDRIAGLLTPDQLQRAIKRSTEIAGEIEPPAEPINGMR